MKEVIFINNHNDTLNVLVSNDTTSSVYELYIEHKEYTMFEFASYIMCRIERITHKSYPLIVNVIRSDVNTWRLSWTCNPYVADVYCDIIGGGLIDRCYRRSSNCIYLKTHVDKASYDEKQDDAHHKLIVEYLKNRLDIEEISFDANVKDMIDISSIVDEPALIKLMINDLQIAHTYHHPHDIRYNAHIGICSKCKPPSDLRITKRDNSMIVGIIAILLIIIIALILIYKGKI
jgi:hypothetical protein